MLEQLAVLLAATEGVFDPVPLDRVEDGKRKIRSAVRNRLGDISRKILDGKKLSDEEKRRILSVADEAMQEDRERRWTAGG